MFASAHGSALPIARESGGVRSRLFTNVCLTKNSQNVST